MITTVTTITTVAAMGIGAVVSIAAVITLIVLLATRELSINAGSSTPLRIARYSAVGILPMAMAFAVIVVVKILEII